MSASGHGRRWTVRLHSRQRERCGAVSSTTAAPARRGLGLPATERPAAGARTHDPVAVLRQHRGEHGQRREHRHQHREHRGDRQPVEEADAGGEHPEQGDHHRGAGEQDRPSGRIHRLDDRLLHVAEREVVLTEARDDEQRVVDPDAETDHQREVRRDVRDAGDVCGQPDQRDAGDQAEAGGDQRHPGGDERAEREQQDDQRRDRPDQGRRTDGEALGVLDHLPARGDLQARHVHRADLIEHGLAGVVRHEVGRLVVVDRRERGLPVARDLDRPVRAVGTPDRDDVRVAGHLSEQLRHRRANLRVVDGAVRVVEHDRVDVAALRGEFLLEQVERPLGLRSGQAEVSGVIAPGSARDGGRDDRHDNPRHEHATAMSDAPACDFQHYVTPGQVSASGHTAPLLSRSDPPGSCLNCVARTLRGLVTFQRRA